jgi:hypothetical protein
MVPFSGYPAGTIVVKTDERSPYLSLGDGRALRRAYSGRDPERQPA